MKRLYFCIFLFLLFFASSCKKNSDSLSYDTFDSLPTVSLEDVFEPITFIPLQSNDSSIVSNVLKVCMSEDSFYILSVNPYRISKFDREGNFISNISREGKAEGEYLVLSDIYYSDSEKMLYIDDAFKGIIKYKADGSYDSTIPLKVKNRQLYVSNSGTLIINNLNMLGKEKYSLIEMTPQKDTLFSASNHCTFDCENVFYIPAHPSFKLNNDGLLFNPACNDTIYSYSTGKLAPKYIIDFPHPVTTRELHDFNRYMIETQFIMDYSEDDKNLYLTIFDRDWDYKQYIMRKRSGEIHRAHYRISEDFNTEFSPRWQYGDMLIDLFDPATLNYTYYKDITTEDSQKAFDFFKNHGIPGIEEDSNPIIMVTKAK